MRQDLLLLDRLRNRPGRIGDEAEHGRAKLRRLVARLAGHHAALVGNRTVAPVGESGRGAVDVDPRLRRRLARQPASALEIGGQRPRPIECGLVERGHGLGVDPAGRLEAIILLQAAYCRDHVRAIAIGRRRRPALGGRRQIAARTQRHGDGGQARVGAAGSNGRTVGYGRAPVRFRLAAGLGISRSQPAIFFVLRGKPGQPGTERIPIDRLVEPGPQVGLRARHAIIGAQPLRIDPSSRQRISERQSGETERGLACRRRLDPPRLGEKGVGIKRMKRRLADRRDQLARCFRVPGRLPAARLIEWDESRVGRSGTKIGFGDAAWTNRRHAVAAVAAVAAAAEISTTAQQEQQDHEKG